MCGDDADRPGSPKSPRATGKKKLLASISTRFFLFCILLLLGKENILFLFLNFLKISDNDGRRGAKDVAK
jgi:hypothetical protein